jgi:hypothetical protein
MRLPTGLLIEADRCKDGTEAEGNLMTTSHIAAADRDLDTIAWKFLGSEYTEPTYSNWTIEQRVDAYLAHHGLMDVVNDGAAYDALLERVMANVGPALRRGLLPPPTL